MADESSNAGGFGSFPEMYELIFEHTNARMLLVERDESGEFRYIEANPALASMMGRYGGEELAVGLPNTDLSPAVIAGRRILSRLRPPPRDGRYSFSEYLADRVARFTRFADRVARFTDGAVPTVDTVSGGPLRPGAKYAIHLLRQRDGDRFEKRGEPRWRCEE